MTSADYVSGVVSLLQKLEEAGATEHVRKIRVALKDADVKQFDTALNNRIGSLLARIKTELREPRWRGVPTVRRYVVEVVSAWVAGYGDDDGEYRSHRDLIIKRLERVSGDPPVPGAEPVGDGGGETPAADEGGGVAGGGGDPPLNGGEETPTIPWAVGGEGIPPADGGGDDTIDIFPTGGDDMTSHEPDEPWLTFTDIKQRNEDARAALERERQALHAHRALRDFTARLAKAKGRTLADRVDWVEKAIKKEGRELTAPERRYVELAGRLDPRRNPIVDKLFLDVAKDTDDVCHVDGVLGTRNRGRCVPSTTVDELSSDEKEVAAKYGLMLLDNRTELSDGKRLFQALSDARAEYRASRHLFDNVLPFVVSPAQTVTARQWVHVVRVLRERGVPSDHPHLESLAEGALRTVIGGSDGGETPAGPPPSMLDISLPSLEDYVDIEIVTANLHAVQALYFASALEELRFFQVADKLVELFLDGVLPIGRGKAGDLLYRYWKASEDRFTEIERRNLAARTFGYPGGEPMQGSPNREFMDLWLRFISAVSEYSRQTKVDHLLRAGMPMRVSQEKVRKSGRDLGANLSLYGYGVAYFAATEMQHQIREIIELLSEPEVMAAYGARDMWQVIDQVATLELGGARNSVRYRTMANSGAIIIRWLAKKADALSSVGRQAILNLDEVSNDFASFGRGSSLDDPSDRDLVDACEQWLAVTGTPDARVEEYAEPREGPNTTSRPIQIPAVARDLLDSVGVSGLSSN